MLLTVCPIGPQAAEPDIKKNTCRTCGKPLANCPYKGKHPARPTPEKSCAKCGKPISKCPYKGKHPAPNPNPTNNKQNEELERLRRENEALRRQQEQQAEAERRRQEAERQRQEAERKKREQTSWNSSTNTLTVNGVTYRMVYVNGGTFQMGTMYVYEKPVHSVTLSSYYIGQTEVTQALWKAVMGSNPSNFKGDNLPVEQVSWKDCQKFIKKLNQLTGEHFRLPTEAEWEFAAKGGRQSKGYTYSGSNNLYDVAWYTDNSGNKTHPVGYKQPNELGIYDMSGNVWEWCQDWFGFYSSSAQTNPTGPTSGYGRIIRGGCCFNDDATYCRTANRNSNLEPSVTSSHVGLRLAR